MSACFGWFEIIAAMGVPLFFLFAVLFDQWLRDNYK